MKRRGVLMALVGSAGASLGAQEISMDVGGGRSSWLRIEIPEKGPKGYPHIVPCRDDAPEGVMCMEEKQPKPYDYALEITGDGRAVRFTAKELMDILEGKS